MKQRILFIRLSALGDIIHVLPALKAARAALPDAYIGWLVEESGAPLIEGHPLLDAVHVMPRKAWRSDPLKTLMGPMRDLIAEVRGRNYETAIDFQGLTKSAYWTRLSGAKQRIGFRGEDAREISSVFYNFAVHPRADDVHVIQRNLALLRPLEIDRPGVEFALELPGESLEFGRRIWGDHGERNPRVVMNPGAGWKTKQWPATAYGRLGMELVREAEARVVLAWGPGEENLVRTAFEAVGQHWDGPQGSAADAPHSIGSEPGLYALPPTRFNELGGVIRGAHLFVGGDTGPAHMAAALGVPTLGIHGASDGKRNGPWGERCSVIQLDEPPCIPCWRTQCNWDEPLACLTHISVQRVREECMRLLAG